MGTIKVPVYDAHGLKVTDFTTSYPPPNSVRIAACEGQAEFDDGSLQHLIAFDAQGLPYTPAPRIAYRTFRLREGRAAGFETLAYFEVL